MALIYGSTGTIDVVELKQYILMRSSHLPHPCSIIGLGFSLSVSASRSPRCPFICGRPMSIRARPPPITAYMATGVKAAAFGALMRVFYTALLPLIASAGPRYHLDHCRPHHDVSGTLRPSSSSDIKRMLAYSSIAHAGYILVAFITGDRDADLECALLSSCLYIHEYRGLHGSHRARKER